MLLLEQYAETKYNEPFSSSFDISMWDHIKREALDTSLSKLSKRSSFSGSRYDLESSQGFRLTRRKKTERSDQSEIQLTSSVKNLATLYTRKIVSNGEYQLRISNERAEYQKYDQEYDYLDHLPLINDYLQQLFRTTSNVSLSILRI